MRIANFLQLNLGGLVVINARMSETPLLDHAIKQVTGKLYKFANRVVDDEITGHYGLRILAMQFVYNVGIATALAGLSDEDSFVTILPLMAYLSGQEKDITPERIVELMKNASERFNALVGPNSEFEFDKDKIRM